MIIPTYLGAGGSGNTSAGILLNNGHNGAVEDNTMFGNGTNFFQGLTGGFVGTNMNICGTSLTVSGSTC
jgi:hypothetical protein